MRYHKSEYKITAVNYDIRSIRSEEIMAYPKSFGKYLLYLRRSRKLTLRGFAAMISVSPFYLSLIENDKKSNPSLDILGRIYSVLKLSKEEMETLLDLHAESNGCVSYDVAYYIVKHREIEGYIRSERDKAGVEWEDFIADITDRSDDTKPVG